MARSTEMLQKLPVEVLGTIFEHCLPEQWLNDWPSSPRSTSADAPLVLLQVCKRWQDIALSCPSLWRRIAIPDFNTLLNPGSYDEHIVLKRSRAVQLHAYIVNPPTTFLIDYASRFAVLELAVTPRRLLRYKDYKPLEAPALRRLRFKLLEERRYLPNEQSYLKGRVVSLFASAPLEVLHLAVPKSFSLDALALPLASLSTLVLCEAYIPEAARVLRQCPRLERCTLAVHPVIPDDIVTIPLRHLQTLEIQLCDRAAECILNYLLAPGLTKLKLVNNTPHMYHQPATAAVAVPLTIPAFLDRSVCTLQTLELSDGCMSGADLATCLESIPTICTLHIYTRDLLMPVVTDELLQALTIGKDGAAALLPRLTALVLDTVRTFIDQTLLEMFLSRCEGRGETRLRMFQLCLAYSFLGAETLLRMTKIEEGGVGFLYKELS